MKRLFLLLPSLFICINLSAQDLPTILPPSPNASALGSYGQVPVGKFTGTIQVNIPLYNFNIGKLNIPISLNYSSNGIKVDEKASNLGFGWVLEAGGVITRTVYDDPDEDQHLAAPTTGVYTQEMLDYLKNASDGDGVDTKPDLFSFNFNGYSGKFFLDDNKKPIMIDPSPVKIEILTTLSNYDPLSNSPEIKITDPSGIIYWFGGGNSSEITFNRSYDCGSHSDPSLPVETAWYLAKITHPTGEEINLLYDRYNNTYDTGMSQTFTKKFRNSLFYGDSETHCLSKVYSQMSLLKEINSLGFGSIKFTYSTGVPNIDSDYNKKLDKVTIQNKNNINIKEYNLEYLVFDSDLSYKNFDVPTKSTDEKRLFLYKITEKGKDGQLNSPYILEYNHPELLPPRFSYAQDFWGYFNGQKSNNHLVSKQGYTLFDGSAIICDKNPNGVFGAKGMLKKIIYPTGGYNEFFYEPHSTNKLGTIYPPKVNKVFSVQTDDVFSGSISDKQQINNLAISQNVYVNTSVMFNSYNNLCDVTTYPSHWIAATLTIKDLSNNQLVNFSQLLSSGILTSLGTSLNIQSSGMPYDQIFATLMQGKSYEIELSVIRPCLYAGASLSYYDQKSETISQNVEIGGVRIQKIITNGSNGINEVKKYYYAQLNDFTISSGIAETAITAYSFSRQINSDLDEIYENYSLSSSTLSPLYLMQGYYIGYNSVIEGIGDNFEGGGISNTYHMQLSALPIITLGNLISGTPYSNIFNIGKELDQKFFKKVNDIFITERSISNLYHHNVALDKQLSVYNVRKATTLGGNINFTLVTEIDQYYINKYYVNSQWHYLESTTEKQYDQNGQNPLTTTSNYFYDNPEHLQVTRTTVTTSDGKEVQTKTSYPQDLVNELFMSNLISANRIGVPIKTEQLNNGIKTAEEKFVYAKDASTNNLLLPKNVYSAKFPNNNPNITTPPVGQLEKKVTYDLYDNKGNPLEVSKADGPHIVYIWGYNQANPIAKIENATYAEIALALGITITDLDTYNESNLVALNALRGSLPNAMVTTYTYDPLIGVTSITDPKGEAIYYHYDNFNRLEYVKDSLGNILSKNEYHYKNQQ